MRIGLAGAGRIGAFHATTLSGLSCVDSVVLADVDADRVREVAGPLGIQTAADVPELLAAGADALVVATPTASHPEMIGLGVRAGIPVFCEKPIALTVDDTLAAVRAAAGGRVQMGFQRRFDPGYQAAKQAAGSGELGWIHTIRSITADAAPPPAAYIPGSGGIFRDCAVHDIDSIRWLTGREVVQAYAVGANRGEDFFREAGDVDTASALLTLDDDTIALVSCTRYNGAGYDVRLEVLGSAGGMVAGLDDSTPLRSADGTGGFPAGPPYQTFQERFATAYRRELAEFVQIVADGGQPACTMGDALEALYVAEACEESRRRRAPVQVAEIRAAKVPR